MTILLSLLLVFVVYGCVSRVVVNVRYSAWGEEIFLSRDHESKRLHIRLAMPPESIEALGCVLIIHGMNEHVGRYAEIATHLAQRFIVAGIDLPGHGLSNRVFYAADRAIARGVEFYDVSNAYLEQAELSDLEPMRVAFEKALSFLAARCDAESDVSEPKPLFIISHSMGSLVAATYYLSLQADNKLRRRIQGIVFSGPAFAVTHVPGWRGWFQNPFINFSFYTHQHFLDPQIEPWPMRAFNQAIAFVTVPIQDGLVELLSSPGLRRAFTPATPSWVEQYHTDSEEERKKRSQDNYIIRESILRYVLGIEQEIIHFRSAMKDFGLPYLLIYSELDPITPAWGNIDFAEVTQDKHPHNEIMPLVGVAHHEQLFSAPKLRQELMQTIDCWLDRRLKAPDNL